MTDKETQLTSLLEQGIAAAKNGQPSRARELLLRVVEGDHEQDLAWLWLSSVVESESDKRLCLENVLAIDPENAAAHRGLARLGGAGEAGEAGNDEMVVRKDIMPLTPAAAVLYPERLVKEWRWRDETGLGSIPQVAYQPFSRYDDVWERETDICAFCAHEVALEDLRCPNCRRKLSSHEFRYPEPSSDFVIYWVLLLGAAQLFFIEMLFDLVLREPLVTAAWHGVVFLLLAALTLGIYLRLFWAYITSIFVLILMFSVMVLDLLSGSAVSNFAAGLTGADYLLALADDPVATFLAPIAELLPSLRLIAVMLALVYGLFRAGPDFERVADRWIAKVDRKLREASQFYLTGKEYAERDMWATTVLHWQRAAAHDPNRWTYHYRLGLAYAHLGFYQRSLDVLESARRLVSEPSARAQIDRAVAQVCQVQSAQAQ